MAQFAEHQQQSTGALNPLHLDHSPKLARSTMTGVSPPWHPRWLSKEKRRAHLNEERERLGRKYGKRDWSYKGIITRIFGQGIQRIFQALPATIDAAISGSMGVAAYDMYQGKRDLNWMPNDVDVFCALTGRYRLAPLQKMFPMMQGFLRSVQGQGYDYRLKDGGSCYGEKMCVFDFECRNANQFSGMHLPKVSFIGRPARSVAAIVREFDFSICGPILRRGIGGGPVDICVTREMRELYKHRRFYSKVLPTRRTARGRSSLKRKKKYEGREFVYFSTGYDRRRTSPAAFPTFPYRYYSDDGPTSRDIVVRLLGREPTKQERVDFNIKF